MNTQKKVDPKFESELPSQFDSLGNFLLEVPHTSPKSSKREVGDLIPKSENHIFSNIFALDKSTKQEALDPKLETTSINFDVKQSYFSNPENLKFSGPDQYIRDEDYSDFDFDEEEDKRIKRKYYLGEKAHIPENLFDFLESIDPENLTNKDTLDDLFLLLDFLNSTKGLETV